MPGTAISFMCAALKALRLQGIGVQENTLLYRFTDNLIELIMQLLLPRSQYVKQIFAVVAG